MKCMNRDGLGVIIPEVGRRSVLIEPQAAQSQSNFKM